MRLGREEHREGARMARRQNRAEEIKAGKLEKMGREGRRIERNLLW
jgi:hypothetical protein